MEGIYNIRPTITQIDFKHKSKITLHLADGRDISCPLDLYPSIKNMKATERRKFKILKGQIIMFQSIDEVYHLQNFLGLQQDYQHK